MESQPTSTRPYLLRALFEWCADNGLTPHIAVAVDDSVVVPREFVKDGEIVLNIGQEAAHGLHIDGDAVTFKARFSGVARDIYVPIGRVIALFARENGQGMAFPAEVTPEFEVDNVQPASTGKAAIQLVNRDPQEAGLGDEDIVERESKIEGPKPDDGLKPSKPTLRRIK
jgi:stringent starvation protein B